MGLAVVQARTELAERAFVRKVLIEADLLHLPHRCVYAFHQMHSIVWEEQSSKVIARGPQAAA